MPTTSTFPGMEEVIKFLEEQATKDAQGKVIPASGGLGQPYTPPRVTLPPARSFPAGPTINVMGGVKVPMTQAGGGMLSESLGGAGSLLRGLGGLGARVAGPVGIATAAYPVLKMGLKSAIDTEYPETSLDKERRESFIGQDRLPTLDELGYPQEHKKFVPPSLPDYLDSANSNKKKQTPTSTEQYGPKLSEGSPMSNSAQLAGLEPHYSDQIEDQPSSPNDGLTEEQRAAMNVPAEEESTNGEISPSEEADSFMKQVLATIEPRGAVQEQPDPESTQDLKELTKERQGVRQAEPTSLIGKVGRGISKFMAAGAGPYDPTRYDRQQLELEKAKQQFTPQEALRGQLAVAEREGRQKFNREAQLENMKTGGLDDVTKLKAGLGTTIYEKQQSRAAKKEELGIEHKNKMEEIGASGASQRESPEAQEARMQREIAVKYLYAFTPKEAKRLTGLDISQQGLDAIRVAAQKDNPMAIAVAQLLQTRIQNMNPQGGKAAPNLTTKALSQGQPEKKK